MPGAGSGKGWDDRERRFRVEATVAMSRQSLAGGHGSRFERLASGRAVVRGPVSTDCTQSEAGPRPDSAKVS